MNGQIIAAEQIRFNENTRSFSIENIYNGITVQVLPSVAVIELLIKTLRIENNDTVQIQIIDQDGDICFFTAPIPVHNQRLSAMISGIDFQLHCRFVVKMEGTYTIQLYAGDSLVNEYPIFIQCHSV